MQEIVYEVLYGAKSLHDRNKRQFDDEEVAKRRREKAAAEVKRKESEEYELFLSLKSKFEGND